MNVLSQLASEALRALNLSEEAKRGLYERIREQHEKGCAEVWETLADVKPYVRRHLKSSEDFVDIFLLDDGDRIIIKTDQETHIHRVDFITKVKLVVEDEVIISQLGAIHVQLQKLPSLV